MFSTQPALKELESQLDRVIEHDMFVNGKSAGEITEMRETKSIEVIIEGGKMEKFSLEEFEIKFEAENGGRRILFPSNPPDFTLKGTELLEGLTKSFGDNVDQIVRERLMKGESKLEEALEKLEKQSESVDATIANLVAYFENVVIVDALNPDMTKNLKREIGEAVIGGGNKVELKMKLSKILASAISESVDSELLVRNRKAAGAWEIVNNQRGKVGENIVSMAVNQLMVQFLGMTVVGLRSHPCPLAEILNGLNLEMGGENSQAGKKERGLIFTWLEEDVLVINMVQTTMLKQKPWRLEYQEKKQQTAADEVQGCLNQLLRDLKTFKELFPDITDIDMKSIR